MPTSEFKFDSFKMLSLDYSTQEVSQENEIDNIQCSVKNAVQIYKNREYVCNLNHIKFILDLSRKDN